MGSDTQTFYLPWKAPLLNFYRESVTWMKLTLGGGYFQNTAQHRHFQGRRNNTNFHTTAQKWSFNLTFPRRGFALSAQHNWNKAINTSSSLSEIQRWITLRSYLRLSPTLPLHPPPSLLFLLLPRWSQLPPPQPQRTGTATRILVWGPCRVW